MGAAKDGGYTQKSTVTPEQKQYLDQLLQRSQQNQGAAANAYGQFLPDSAGGQVGGQGGQAFIDQALENYRQKFIPEAFNAYGAGANSKGSSALNNALAQGGADMSTQLATLLAQLQQNSAAGLAGIGGQQGQLGTQDQFAFMPKQQPFWQSALLGGAGAAGQLGGPYLQWLASRNKKPVTNPTG